MIEGHDLPPKPALVLEYARLIASGVATDIESDGELVAFIEACEPGASLRDLGMAGYAGFVEWHDEQPEEPREGTWPFAVKLRHAFFAGFQAAAEVVKQAQLPAGFIWSESNIQKFNFGWETALGMLDDRACGEAWVNYAPMPKTRICGFCDGTGENDDGEECDACDGCGTIIEE